MDRQERQPGCVNEERARERAGAILEILRPLKPAGRRALGVGARWFAAQLAGQRRAQQYPRRRISVQAQPGARQFSHLVAHIEWRVIDARPAAPDPAG